MSFGYQLDLFHLSFPSTLCRLRDIRFVLSEMLQHGLCKYVWISLLAHHAHACAITIHSAPYSVYKCVLILISTFLRGSSDASPTLLRTVLIIRAHLVNRCDNCLEEELPPPPFFVMYVLILYLKKIRLTFKRAGAVTSSKIKSGPIYMVVNRWPIQDRADEQQTWQQYIHYLLHVPATV